MFLGHFAVAVAARPLVPQVPLWVLLVAAQWLDVVVLALMPFGVEGLAPGSAPLDYGGIVGRLVYSHSLLLALIMALLIGLLARHWWRDQLAGLVIGALVFSHWALDFPVHHADMPWLPGNLGGFNLLGLGWYAHALPTLLLEVVMMVLALAWSYREYYSGAIASVRRQWSLLSAFSAMTVLVHLLQMPGHNVLAPLLVAVLPELSR